jgi:hypothetical protein
MSLQRRPRAIFAFTKSAPQFIQNTQAFTTALKKEPAKTLLSIPPADITAVETKLAALIRKQAIVKKRRIGSAAIRDTAWHKAILHVRKLLNHVQRAADNAANLPEAVHIIQSCGLRLRKPRVVTKPDVEVRRDEDTIGLVHLISRARPKRDKAIYVWDVSTNGRSFTNIKISAKSKTTWQTPLPQGTKLIFRRGIITRGNDDAIVWSQPITFYLT